MKYRVHIKDQLVARFLTEIDAVTFAKAATLNNDESMVVSTSDGWVTIYVSKGFAK